MRQAAYKPNLNLVQSAHACSSTYFLPRSNHGQRWLLNDATGDEVTLDGKLPAPAFKLPTAQFPDANSVKFLDVAAFKSKNKGNFNKKKGKNMIPTTNASPLLL